MNEEMTRDKRKTESKCIHLEDIDMNTQEVKQVMDLTFKSITTENIERLDGSENKGDPSDENMFPCNRCKDVLQSEALLNKHMKIHEINGRKHLKTSQNVQPAALLNSKSSCLQDLSTSLRKDASETDVEKFICPVCSKTFTRRYTLNRHIEQTCKEEYSAIVKDKVVIEGKALYRCRHCRKHLRTRYSYIRHLRIHSGEKPHTCHVCGKQFRTTALLNRHMHDVHEGIKLHSCDLCGRKFANKRAMEEHRRVHTGERPCVCHVCGKAYKTKASLYIHGLFHSKELPHKCLHCDKSFRRRNELRIHNMLHTGEKPHECGTCGKSFRLIVALKRHVTTHSDDKPFTCLICEQTFAQKRYLKSHERTHGIRFVT